MSGAGPGMAERAPGLVPGSLLAWVGLGGPRAQGWRSSSRLSLFTINGRKVAEQASADGITSLVFTSTPEGVAANAVATGHAVGGLIRLWSSWDLAPLRDISTHHVHSPIVALTFSVDNQNLYAATDDDYVIIFEKANFTGLKRPPKYLNLDAN